MRETRFGFVGPEDLGLFTDLYELTMMQGYAAADHDPVATFDLFVRDLPADRGYLVAAGLEQVVHYLEHVEFDDAALDHLAGQGFDDAFLDDLADFSFEGDVRAVPEGTAVFPDEPIVEITAPVSQAQLFETMLINQVAFQTMIATKAARMGEVVERQGGEQALVDFGSRRAHGTDAGMKAARAAYLAGFEGTSNVAAGRAFDIPVSGTMAHSWIESFDTEREAFEAYVDRYGEDSVLLIDTYDTLAAADFVAEEFDDRIRGVRIDSGDLAARSREVADRIDSDVFVSSGLDEYAIREFLDAGGVADGFGVGTNLVTSRDAPALEAVYKLVAVEDEPVMKFSQGKRTLPGRKQVRRVRDGEMRDIIGLRDEDLPGEPLLEPVMEDGERVRDLPSIEEVRERAAASRRSLPRDVRDISDPAAYPVETTERLEGEIERLRAERA